MTDFSTIAVVGLGTMGAGIAQVLATSGRGVIAVEADSERLTRGRDAITQFLSGGVSRGKLSSSDAEQILGRITFTTDFDAIAPADAVLESVSEDLGVKIDVLTRAAHLVGADIPLLTNTSALSVTELAAALPGSHRVAGLHFFNPAPVMRTVEIVRALETDAELIERLRTLVGSLSDKDPVVVADRPGFLINALLLPYLNDVITEYDDELASAEDIDVAIKLGLGYRSGPLEMLDLIGLDVHLHATESAYQSARDARYNPPPLLRQMVAAGHLGTKNGKGFRTSENEDPR